MFDKSVIYKYKQAPSSLSFRVLTASLESRESRESLDRRVMLVPLDRKDPLVPLDLQWVSLDIFFFLTYLC